tara:strand:+ start:227 stop:571 length:345 start_codon:yes stop_codon:yes gene_type:complete
MATIRMVDPFEAEAQKPNKQLTIRDRQVIRNILADAVNTEASQTVNLQIADYLKHKDCEFQGARITQNDHNWLKVEVHLGEFKGIETMTKRTMYEFKQRHPNNPAPTNHDQPRN